MPPARAPALPALAALRCGLRCGLRGLSGGARWEAAARSAAEMEALGARFLRARVRAGDVVLLESDVGGGKSVFARGAIRAAMADPALVVPSPTFLLELVYGPALEPAACAGALLRHYDLYRLPEISRADEEAFEWDHALLRRDVCFIEWPEAAKPLLRRSRAPGRIWTVRISETPAAPREPQPKACRNPAPRDDDSLDEDMDDDDDDDDGPEEEEFERNVVISLGLDPT